jgi:hypothetical protein
MMRPGLMASWFETFGCAELLTMRVGGYSPALLGLCRRASAHLNATSLSG